MSNQSTTCDIGLRHLGANARLSKELPGQVVLPIHHTTTIVLIVYGQFLKIKEMPVLIVFLKILERVTTPSITQLPPLSVIGDRSELTAEGYVLSNVVVKVLKFEEILVEKFDVADDDAIVATQPYGTEGAPSVSNSPTPSARFWSRDGMVRDLIKSCPDFRH